MEAVQTEHNRLADHVQEIAYNISNGIVVTKEDIDDDRYDLEYEIGIFYRLPTTCRTH